VSEPFVPVFKIEISDEAEYYKSRKDDSGDQERVNIKNIK
jgi:hypothetical protein